MTVLDFGRRAEPPCGDCDVRGRCTMNCGPRLTAGGDDGASGDEKPDFAELRRRRDAALERTIQEICDEWGWDRDEVLVHVSPGGCYCACPDGPCEHEWRGWRDFEDGCGGERVCAKCGAGAMGHDMRVLP